MKTLRQMLGEYNEEQLKQIASWWGIGKAPDGGWKNNQALLIQAMQDPIAARFAWEHLSADERTVLHSALQVSSSNGILPNVLQTLTRLPEQSFAAALTTLKSHLLLLENPVKVKSKVVTSSKSAGAQPKTTVTQETVMLAVPPEINGSLHAIGREIFETQYNRAEMKLENLLATLNQSTLYTIGGHYGIVLNDYYSRSTPSSRLAGNLVQPDLIAYAFEQLDPTTRKLCTWLCDQGGKVSLQAVRDYTGFDDPTLATIIRKFEQYALAFDTFAGPERVLFVPRELLKGLKKAVTQADTLPVLPPTGLVALDAPPEVIRAGDTLLVYDMAVIIGAMYQQDIEPTKSSTVPKRIVTKIQPLLHVHPRINAYDLENFTVDMLYSLARVLGLVQLSSEATPDIKQHYEPGPQLEQWSRLSVFEQNQRLLEHWLTSRYWADLPGANYNANYSYYLDYITPRNALLGYLNECTPGRWYTVASLMNTIKAQDPYLARPRQAGSSVVNYRLAKDIMANWDRCDGQYILGILASSLHELGIVALGYEQAQPSDAQKPVNPDAFMLTDLGAAILKKPGSKPPVYESGRTLVVQPNFELLLLQPDSPTLYNLLPFAQVNQVGMVSRLTLTRNSVLRGMAAGKKMEQVIQFLEQQSQKELPQNVVYTLRDWTKAYKEATIAQVVLIEVENEALASEICQSSKFKKFNLRRLGPTAIAASGDTTLQDLRRVLDKDGYVVRISGDTAAQAGSKRYPLTYGRPR
jgi:Helicase conserved C-terminal domain